MKILNIYYSSTGNTRKVAETITKTLKEMGQSVDVIEVKEKEDISVDLLEYDLIFAGSGVYQWLPGRPIQELFTRLLWKYFEKGEIKPSAPRRGKKAVIYCTYGGAHTGINEAIPAVKYMGQLFDHLGFDIIAEWYIVGEYRTEKLKRFSEEGRMGNIKGRPDEKDLKDISEKVKGIIKALK